MKFTLLIPHYKTGPLTAFTVSQVLKFKGRHEVDIVVIDNNPGDGSTEYLSPFMKDITIVEYPKERIQSHGVAFDYVLAAISTEWFITLESDSYPTIDHFLDYYEVLINTGHDAAGSVMRLSGGIYVHPAGALYSKKLWQEAKDYCDSVPYAYFPNIAMKEGHPCHLMVHKRVFDEFIKEPEKFIEVSPQYFKHTPLSLVTTMEHYAPVVGPFHSGLGNAQESILTYFKRDIESEVPNILLDGKEDFIYRLGYEPGQSLCYFALAQKKKIYSIPTQLKWMKGREGQQQEYTMTENGICHLWAGSAHLAMKNTEFHDIYEAKSKKIQALYDSLPSEQKIPS